MTSRNEIVSKPTQHSPQTPIFTRVLKAEKLALHKQRLERNAAYSLSPSAAAPSPPAAELAPPSAVELAPPPAAALALPPVGTPSPTHAAALPTPPVATPSPTHAAAPPPPPPPAAVLASASAVAPSPPAAVLAPTPALTTAGAAVSPEVLALFAQIQVQIAQLRNRVDFLEVQVAASGALIIAPTDRLT